MTSDLEGEADQEAANWFARLRAPTVSLRELEEFRVWKAAPGNTAAYDRLESLWSRSGRLDQDDGIATAIAEAKNRPDTRTRVRVWGIAGAVAALGLCLGVWTLVSRPTIFDTAVGEQRLLQLEDGSRVHLDADSRIEVSMGREGRRIALDRGRAFFIVATDPARPFAVTAGDTRVQATGTRFVVGRLDRGARVTLVEGGVRVEARTETGLRTWRLEPGQQLTTARAQARPTTVRTEPVLQWTEGRLAFDRTPLSEAAAEVSRYDRRRVRLSPGVDPTLEITGVFDAGDAPAFADAVARLYGLRSETSAEGVTIGPRPDENS